MDSNGNTQVEEQLSSFFQGTETTADVPAKDAPQHEEKVATPMTPERKLHWTQTPEGKIRQQKLQHTAQIQRRAAERGEAHLKFECRTCKKEFNDPVYHRAQNPKHVIVRREDGRAVGSRGNYRKSSKPLLADLAKGEFRTLSHTKHAPKFRCLNCKTQFGDGSYHLKHNPGHKVQRIADGHIVGARSGKKGKTHWTQTARGRKFMSQTAASRFSGGKADGRHKIISVLGSTVEGANGRPVEHGGSDFAAGFAAGFAYREKLESLVHVFSTEHNIPLKMLASAIQAVKLEGE